MALLDPQQAERLDAIGLDAEGGAGGQHRAPDVLGIAGGVGDLIGLLAGEAEAEEPGGDAGR